MIDFTRPEFREARGYTAFHPQFYAIQFELYIPDHKKRQALIEERAFLNDWLQVKMGGVDLNGRVQRCLDELDIIEKQLKE